MFFDPITERGTILIANTELNTDGEKQYHNILDKLVTKNRRYKLLLSK
jgi:hypothetical protein